MPLRHTGEGVPLGVYLTGRFGDEATVLALTGQLEHARSYIRFPGRPHSIRPGCAGARV